MSIVTKQEVFAAIQTLLAEKKPVSIRNVRSALARSDPPRYGGAPQLRQTVIKLLRAEWRRE